ncbi:MAG: diaminopimelate decarboxylase [Fusobacterium varium]|jgi:diaminopimelate decarboxylase|uniref:diaminopimelate decarboxylase n=1 Tax=Fusobacterium varium TaxID=856 RepID=UPI00242C061F|nr:diaminopimelate decarboxylase [Fusobacterium varium]UYI78094.1 MAG: diaminopimelate decarboxylase [Fusobacterium varium]
MKLFGTMKAENGILEIGGIKVTELAEKYGTPLYIMDQSLIEENIIKYKNNFKSSKFDTSIVYASKAFLSKAICQLVEKYDIEIDAVSGGELYTIKTSGLPMKKVHMHGNNKTDEELEMCLDYEIGSIIIDNEEEIERLSRICKEKNKKIKVMMRINIGIDAHTHEYIKTSKHSSKFGESIFDERITEIVGKIVKDENMEFLGFHCHIGSQIFDTKAFHEGIESMVKETKKISEVLGIYIPEINLGGGFGVYYTDKDTAIDVEQFMKSMIEHLERSLEAEKMKLKKVSIEPGRSIVANAGSTLYTVGGTKTTYGGVKYIFIDGGMTDNIRPALYQAEYEAVVANKINEPAEDVVTIAGKCCESGDLIIKNGKLAKAETGDLILVATTGAYGYSMSNNYNKAPRPAVVFVKDGKSALSIKRESLEDLVRNDVLIDI